MSRIAPSKNAGKWAQVASGNNSVTSRSGFEKRLPISLAYKDVMRSLRRAERESVPAGGGSSPPFPGGFGPHARRQYDRCVGCCHWTGTGDDGYLPERPRPRKPGLKQSLWDQRPSGKSRGGTPRGERAALCARRTPQGVRRLATRLSAFRFLAFFSYIRGLKHGS